MPVDEQTWKAMAILDWFINDAIIRKNANDEEERADGEILLHGFLKLKKAMLKAGLE